VFSETYKNWVIVWLMDIPALAGYTDESSIMPYFEEFVCVFRDIEKLGYCVVDGQQHKVHIRPFVVGDLAFEQKCLQRGVGSGKTTRFCFMCSNTCHYRHKGYPGGCWKCRELGIVYDEETGVQQCLCHDVCTTPPREGRAPWYQGAQYI
jgi:hypothetical protein